MVEESSERGDCHKHGVRKHLSSIAVPSFNLHSVVSHMIGMMMMMSAVRTPNLAYSMVLDFHGTFYFKFYFVFRFKVLFIHRLCTVSHCINYRGCAALKGVSLNVVLAFTLQKSNKHKQQLDIIDLSKNVWETLFNLLMTEQLTWDNIVLNFVTSRTFSYTA